MINSICLPKKDNERLKPETTAFIAGWGGKYPTGDMNSFGSFHLKQGLVYIKSNEYCKQVFSSFDEYDEICATNTNDNVDSRGRFLDFSFDLPLFIMIVFVNLSHELKMNDVVF